MLSFLRTVIAALASATSRPATTRAPRLPITPIALSALGGVLRGFLAITAQ